MKNTGYAIDTEKKEFFCENSLLWALFIPCLNEFLSPLMTAYIGVSVSAALYIAYLIYAVWNINKYRLITLEKIFLYAVILLFFWINKRIYSDRAEYFETTEMKLNYFFFIPISIFSITAIRNWNSFMKHGNKFAIAAVVSSLLKMFTFNVLETTNYMNFSYVFLPFVGILTYNFIDGYKMSLSALGMLGGFFCMIKFGARSPLLFLIILFVLLIAFKKFSGKKMMLILLGLGICIVLYMNYGAIAEKLINIDMFKDSYIVSRLYRRKLFESKARRELYVRCRILISEMGMDINGIFYDRYISNQAYSHNIVYEILLSCGWIFGTLFLGSMLFASVGAFIKANREGKCVLSMFFMVLMARFFVSGSYVTEFRFYIYIAVVYALLKTYSDKKAT